MFGKMEFRMIINKLDSSAMDMTDLLKKEGFEVYDLKEADVVQISDRSKVQSVYILCIRGEEREFEKFKHKHQITEINHEGFRTLI